MRSVTEDYEPPGAASTQSSGSESRSEPELPAVRAGSNDNVVIRRNFAGEAAIASVDIQENQDQKGTSQNETPYDAARETSILNSNTQMQQNVEDGAESHEVETSRPQQDYIPPRSEEEISGRETNSGKLGDGDPLSPISVYDN